MVLDIETTGLDPATDRILEVAVLSRAPGTEARLWYSALNPGVEVPASIARFLGVEGVDLSTRPRFDDISTELEAQLRGAALVSCNGAGFDWPFLSAEFRRVGKTLPTPLLLDPLLWASEVAGHPIRKLARACTEFGLEAPISPGARDACATTDRLASALVGRVPSSTSEVIELQARWRSAN